MNEWMNEWISEWVSERQATDCDEHNSRKEDFFIEEEEMMIIFIHCINWYDKWRRKGATEQVNWKKWTWEALQQIFTFVSSSVHEQMKVYIEKECK